MRVRAWSLPFFVYLVAGCNRYLPKESDAPVVAKRGAPIIATIERYHRDQGQYPRSLEELTPKYLAVVPHPGLRTDRPYVLQHPERGPDRLWTGNAPYAIAVDFAPSETLVYRPTRKYEDLGRRKEAGRPIDGWYLSGID